jgi:putative flippase GtrA
VDGASCGPAALGLITFGQKAMRYSLVSVISTVLGELTIALAFDVFGWTARSSALLATAIATGPAYVLNRRLVWRMHGASGLTREVLPFWLLAFAGLGVSTWAAGEAEVLGRAITTSRLGQTAIVLVGTLVSLAALWVGRFLVFDRLVFAAASDRDQREPEPADVSG